jgi:ubiquinol-cytochrome c reductase cytochrome b subunit
VRLGDWLDDRTGYRVLGRRAFGEPVRGGARWAYVFGSALAMTFAMQIATGILLALFYSPSSKEAWGSVHYIQHEVLLGWFVRGLHHYGSSAMVILVVLHMFQAFVYRAYAPPREINWWTGLVLFGIVLGFSVTGYLLPWDQKGFWATRVVTSIAGAFPWIGDWIKTTMQGGNDLGNLTLTRFFGFHVFILPALLGLVLVVHVAVFRRHGVTVAPGRANRASDIEAGTEPFWPRQVTYDVAFFALVVAILVGLTAVRGASLEAPADPSSGYPARPEWYFLWLFELLKIVPGQLEGVAMLGLTVVFALFLAALPLVDRKATATMRSRWPHFVIAGGIAAMVMALTVLPLIEDARDRGLAAQRAALSRDAERAFLLAKKGIPPGGASELYQNDPIERGKRLFAAECQACHRLGDKGGDTAPDLTGYMTADWIRGVTADPTRPRFFGRTTLTAMPPTDATPQQLDTLTAYQMSLGALAPEPPGGAELFEELGCQTCHARAGEKPRMGPSLAGYGSRAWIVGAIKNPGALEYYGDDNKMPAFAGKLTDAQLDDIVTYILSGEPTTEKSP